MIFQILLIVFALFAAWRTWRQYRQKKVSGYWFGLWILFWLLVIGVALAPQTTDIAAAFVGVEKGADLLVYCAVVIVYYALYRVLIKIEKQNRELTELTRQIALMKAAKKEGRKLALEQENEN